LRASFDFNPDRACTPLLSIGVRKKAIRKVLPWLFWAVVLAVLTAVGMRNSKEATGMTNPRSLNQSPSTMPGITKPGADCVGGGLMARSTFDAKP
jgi:hypothetical protein